MLRNLAVLLIAAVALCGCVLESRQPLFAESDGVLVLGPSPPPLAAWNLKVGQWVRSGPDDPPLQLVAEAHHYVGVDPDKPSERMTMLFVPLEGGHYALQFSSTKEPNTAYAIAEVAGQDVVVRPLFCTELKKIAGLEASITYDHDSCLVGPEQNAKNLMTKLAGLLPAADMKLAPLP